MELQNVLNNRRSMRNYDAAKKVTKEQVETIINAAKKVTKEQVETIINAAILAPSWKNLQTSRYYCILSDEKIEEFRQKCLPEFNQKNAEGAALVVATFVKGCVGFDRLSGEPVNECGNGWGYYDLGLQNENFVLKAKELGLDTLIMGIRDGEAIRNFLDVPENEQIVSVIAVGYGAKDVQMPKRKSVSEIVKFY